MTVEELIGELKKCPAGHEVFVWGVETGAAFLEHVHVSTEGIALVTNSAWPRYKQLNGGPVNG